MLTLVRQGQIVGNKHDGYNPIRWRDIDFEEKLWTCQQHKTRKKAKAAHIIPLSRQAMALLVRMKQRQAEGTKSEFVFVHDGGHPIDQATVAFFMKKTLGRQDITRHGFRTTFKTWAGENGYPETDSEMVLAHMNLRGAEGERVLLNKGTRMYERDIKRIGPRRMMLQDWADFLDRTEPLPASVIPFKKARGKGQ
jgi:integrase